MTILAIVLAESVPRFDLVMSIIGGSLTGPIVFILPPMLYVKMLLLKQEHEKRLQLESVINAELKDESEDLQNETISIQQNIDEQFSFRQCVRYVTNDRTQKVLCCLTATFGVCSMILTTYVNVINTVQYANFSRPCIYNLSMYLQ